MKTLGMLLIAGGVAAYIAAPEQTKAVAKVLRDRMAQMCSEMRGCCEEAMKHHGADKIQEQNARIIELLEELKASGKPAPKKAGTGEGGG